MEQKELLFLDEDKLEKYIEEILLENDGELLNYLYDQMINSKYIKKKAYKNRIKTKMSSYSDS